MEHNQRLAPHLHNSLATSCGYTGASSVAQMVNKLPAMQIRVLSLGRENPLEKGMAPHSSILPWELPWTEKPGGLWSIGSQRVRHD